MRLGATIAGLALAAALASVFALQVDDPGFSPGHRGWVSANTLAVAQRASLTTGLVGYAVSIAKPDGGRDFYYFDRYPPFFSAALHGAMELLAGDKAGEIRVARQAMNLVYALTVVAAVLLLRELGVGTGAAVAAAALAASSYTMVEYRDMVHYDQPALLGSVVLLWAIAAWRRRGSEGAVYAAAMLAVASGRGYASLPILGSWVLLEVVAARTAGPGRRAGAAAPRGEEEEAAAPGVAARALLLGLLVAACSLAWNVAVEARVRGVPWSQTSIVASATRRLSLDETFNTVREQRLDWGHYAAIQQRNLARMAVPWQRRLPFRQRAGAAAGLSSVVLAIALAFALSRPWPERGPWLAMVIAGPAWLALMRNLAAFHPYTSIFYFPLLLVFFSALLHVVPRRLELVPALLACALLVHVTAERNRELGRDAALAASDTADMARVAQALEPGDVVVVDRKVFHGLPFAAAFYLPDQDLAAYTGSTLLLVRAEKVRGKNLTPGNQEIFLYRTDEPAKAKASVARQLPGLLPPDARERREPGRP